MLFPLDSALLQSFRSSFLESQPTASQTPEAPSPSTLSFATPLIWRGFVLPAEPFLKTPITFKH